MILFLPKFKRNLTMNGVITLQQLLCYKYVIQDLFLILSNLKLPIDRATRGPLDGFAYSLTVNAIYCINVAIQFENIFKAQQFSVKTTDETKHDIGFKKPVTGNLPTAFT